MNNDYDSDDVEQGLDDNKQSYTLYENSTYMVVSKVAYLIGVPKAIFENEHEPPKMEWYEELQQDEEHYRKSQEEQAHGSQLHGERAGEQDANRKESREEEDGTGPEPVKKGPGIMGKIKGFPGRISQSIRHILEKLKFSFAKICDKLKGIREFVQEKKMWLEDEKNQASLKLLYRQTKRLLVHLWPRKGRCTVTFGFDDPYTTGQVLQAASLIYPFYHRQLFLYPVFDEKILDAEGSLKGRIRLSVILWLVLQVLFDGHTRRMLKGFLK